MYIQTYNTRPDEQLIDSTPEGKSFLLLASKG